MLLTNWSDVPLLLVWLSTKTYKHINVDSVFPLGTAQQLIQQAFHKIALRANQCVSN